MKKEIVLLHGALGSEKQLRPVKEKLEAHFEQVYTFDFEGHASFVSETPLSIEHFARQTETFIRAQNLEGIDVFGYSMGGYVALTAAKNNPGLIGRLVTLGTKFNWSPESAAKQVKMMNPTKIEEKVPAFARLLEHEQAPQDWKKVMERTADMMLRMGEGERLFKADFETIHLPVTIGIGNKDAMVSIEESEEVAGWLLNARLQVLEDVKHPISGIDADFLANYVIQALNAMA